MQIEKDQQVIDAAEEIAIETYASLNRESTREMGFDDEDLLKLCYSDNPGREDGFLLAMIHSSRIVEYRSEPDEYWTIEVTVDIGIVLPPQEYTVYQGPSGDWVVEQTYW